MTGKATNESPCDVNRSIVVWLGSMGVFLIAALTLCIVLHLEIAAAALVGPLGTIIGNLGTTLTGKPEKPAAGPNTTNTGDINVAPDPPATTPAESSTP